MYTNLYIVFPQRPQYEEMGGTLCEVFGSCEDLECDTVKFDICLPMCRGNRYLSLQVRGKE
jgi:hypothetical protein